MAGVLPSDPPPSAADPAVVVVLITIPEAQAASLSRHLVEDGLAACVNQLPAVHSTYTWAGRVEEADETLLYVKTTVARYGELERRVRELHPYEMPEMLAVPVAAGFAPYLDWIKRSVSPA
ncbi:MAG TPA: divalent-cation tolerance protein CutA [Steroidobacteraceae bacterium]|nr:divalent-cation tolerance protein CutA [Steroidobacteraceae bacterium]